MFECRDAAKALYGTIDIFDNGGKLDSSEVPRRDGVSRSSILRTTRATARAFGGGGGAFNDIVITKDGLVDWFVFRGGLHCEKNRPLSAPAYRRGTLTMKRQAVLRCAVLCCLYVHMQMAAWSRGGQNGQPVRMKKVEMWLWRRQRENMGPALYGLRHGAGFQWTAERRGRER